MSKSYGKNIRVVSEIPPNDGVYDGVWGGHLVRFSANNVTYEFETDVGIRTQCASCMVTVSSGEYSVKTNDEE